MTSNQPSRFAIRSKMYFPAEVVDLTDQPKKTITSSQPRYTAPPPSNRTPLTTSSKPILLKCTPVDDSITMPTSSSHSYFVDGHPFTIDNHGDVRWGNDKQRVTFIRSPRNNHRGGFILPDQDNSVVSAAVADANADAGTNVHLSPSHPHPHPLVSMNRKTRKRKHRRHHHDSKKQKHKHKHK